MGETPENAVAKAVVECVYKVHFALGPGLFESVYERVLCYELTKLGFDAKCQAPMRVIYDGIEFDEGFRADIIVNDLVLVELKSVEKLGAVSKKQVITYLKLTGLRLGLLVNFGESLIKDGITRIANGLPD